MKIKLTLQIRPETKKTSNRIARFGRHKEFIRILPSERYEEWFESMMAIKPELLSQLKSVPLPLTSDVHVEAIFYRERAAGDMTGYMQALGDLLQAERWRTDEHGVLKRTRDGLGIIRDDAQIVSWDGTRLRKDTARPRIEVVVETVGPAQDRLGLEGGPG